MTHNVKTFWCHPIRVPGTVVQGEAVNTHYATFHMRQKLEFGDGNCITSKVTMFKLQILVEQFVALVHTTTSLQVEVAQYHHYD